MYQMTTISDVAAFDAFQKDHPLVKYIWLENIDYTGTTRLRMIPVAAFRKHLSSGKFPGITLALPKLIQNDTYAAGNCPTGEIKMVPDMSSITPNAVIQSPSATVQAWWMDGDEFPQTHNYACPRWALQKHVNALESEFNLTMLMGFEIEIVFMRPIYTDDKSSFSRFDPLNMVHSWSGITHQSLNTLPMTEEIVETLASIGIELSQFHTEAAPGQWEFPLPCDSPLKAIDTLYKAREIISWVAHKHGLKATLYPRPYNFSCGSASHTHFSLNGDSDTVTTHSPSFLAGVLEHLPSILAFSLPIEESYARVTAGVWAGGEWVTWGTQNREVPLRKCGPAHWELKAIDGVGNMFLTMAALVASGLYGLRQQRVLTWKDNLNDASLLSAEQRAELGITTKLPKRLSESLSLLAKNQVLREYLGGELVDTYVATKEHEMATMGNMGDKERKTWLMARY